MSNLIPKLEFIAQALFRKQLNCPHCRSKNLVQIAKKSLTINIKKCNLCDLYFTDPIYQPLLISNLYDRLYSAEGSTTYLPKNNDLENLKNNLFQSSDKYFGDRIQSMKSHILGRKILELGSSWGYFLYQAKHQGFDVAGVEISDFRRQFGIQNLGLDIVKDTRALNGRTFDIVYTAHTLEHFCDLSTIFKDLYNLLNQGGKLLIEVPNFDYEVFGKKALPVMGAVHPLGFSSEFFKKNLPNYGFNIVGFYNSWSSFPQNKVDRSQYEVIILLAEKEC